MPKNNRIEFSPRDPRGYVRPNADATAINFSSSEASDDAARLGREAFERDQKRREQNQPEPKRRKPDALSAAAEANTNRADARPWQAAHDDLRRALVDERHARDAELRPKSDTADVYREYKRQLGLDKEDRTRDVGPGS